MKVLLIWATLAMVFVESYSFVAGQRDSFISIHEEELVKNISDLTKLNTSLKSQLCVDKNGNNIIGLVAFKTDCRKFVQCGDDFEAISNCQEGLLFNDVTKYCDWPRNANCVEFEGKVKNKLVIPTIELNM